MTSEHDSSPASPKTDFLSFGLEPQLLPALDPMGVSVPTPIQRESIPVALAGRNLVAVAQTGSGKTLAYLLSLLTLLLRSQDARAVILTPSRETADQVFRVATALIGSAPISSALVATGSTMADQAKILRKSPRLIVATPGRLGEHLQMNKLLLKGLSILVVDEADRMLEMGFEPQLKFIQSTLRGERSTWMFAASFGASSEPVAKLFMTSEPTMIRTEGAGSAVEELSQKVVFLAQAQKERRLVDELSKVKGTVIIFTDSHESCVALGRLLPYHEFESEFVHGDMKPGHRSRVLREFREGRFRILVATDLLARGLDVPDVACVLNYDLPYKAEDFLHRIGRTARAGRSGSALTFVTPSDGRTYRKIKEYLKGAREEMAMTNFKFIERD